jgi:hypothetical protein
MRPRLDSRSSRSSGSVLLHAAQFNRAEIALEGSVESEGASMEQPRFVFAPVALYGVSDNGDI